MGNIIVPARFQAQIFYGDEIVAESESFDLMQDALRKLRNPNWWPGDFTVGEIQRCIFVVVDQATGDCTTYSFTEIFTNE